MGRALQGGQGRLEPKGTRRVQCITHANHRLLSAFTRAPSVTRVLPLNKARERCLPPLLYR